MTKVIKKDSGRKALGPSDTAVEIFVEEAKNLSIGKITFRPGQKTANHVREVDETLFILKGKTTVVVEDSQRHDLEEGDCIYLPAGTLHRHENNSPEEFSQLWVFAPAGPEKTFKPT